jgi:hypothetical protein
VNVLSKSDIQKLTDNELIAHYLKYKDKLRKELRRHYSLQCGWAKEEIDKRGLTV